MPNSPSDSRLNIVRENITKAEKACDLSPGDIRLIAVSKTRTADEIRQLHVLNQLDFGENYVQEAIEKIALLTDTSITWHFIGPIQKNKTRLIAENFAWVHSVDREVIATRLSDQNPPDKPPLNICIQVNIDQESSKSGVSPQEVPSLAKHIDKLPRLVLRGLMAIPSKTDRVDKQRLAFKKMHDLFRALQENHTSVDTLSMGMSGDYPLAIECGANMIRIGTALFGPRVK